MSQLPVVIKSHGQAKDSFFVAGVIPVRVLAFNFICFFAIACILRFAVLPVIDSAFLGGVQGDAGLYVWLIKSNLRDLFRLEWFSTTAFYPYLLSLGWSDNYILPALLVAPLLAIGISLPFAYNLLHIGALAMGGLAVFVLLTHLTNFPRHAFFAGVAFMALGVFTAHLGHPQLQWAFFLPLLLVGVSRMIHERSFASGALTGLFFSAALGTTAYYAVFGAVLCGAFILAVFLLRPSRLLDLRYVRSILGGVVGLLPAIPLLVPYFKVKGVFGGREIYEAHYFSASPISYFSASSFSWLYSWTSSLSHAEAQLFPGLLLLIAPFLALRRLWDVPPLRRLLTCCAGLIVTLLIVSLFAKSSPGLRVLMALFSWGALVSFSAVVFRLGRLEESRGFHVMTNRGLIAVFSWVLLLFFLISLGPLGNPEKGHLALGVYQLFYWVFPGFDAVRAIGRAGIVTSLMMVLLYALYLTHYVRNTRVFILLSAIIVFENIPRHFPIEKLTDKPKILSQLEAIPDSRDAAVVLPLATQFDEYRRVSRWSEYANLNIEAMLWGFDSGRFFVNGYSGQRSKVMRELPYSLSGFPDDRAMRALARIGGLRYVVVRGAKYPNFDKEAFNTALRANSKHIRVLAVQDSDYLLEFSPMSALKDGVEVLVPSVPGAEIELWVKAPSNDKEVGVELVVGEVDYKTFQFQGATTHKVQFKLPANLPPGRPTLLSLVADGDAILVRTRVVSGLLVDE